MKTTLALLLATTAVVGTLGLPALSSITGKTGDGVGPALTAPDANGAFSTFLLASKDDDDHHDRRKSSGDDGDDDDDDDHDDDDDDRGRPATSSASAGAVAPPANGLFGDGALPQARTN